MSAKRSLYFGCLGGLGHYLNDGTGHRAISTGHVPGLPWNIGHMDAQLLKNGKRPDVYDGRVFWTCGGRDLNADLWFAFYWWDRSVDKRGASNSGFYVHGFPWPEVEAAFAFAFERWPNVIERQRQPLVLQITPDEAARIQRARATTAEVAAP